MLFLLCHAVYTTTTRGPIAPSTTQKHAYTYAWTGTYGQIHTLTLCSGSGLMENGSIDRTIRFPVRFNASLFFAQVHTCTDRVCHMMKQRKNLNGMVCYHERNNVKTMDTTEIHFMTPLTHLIAPKRTELSRAYEAQLSDLR